MNGWIKIHRQLMEKPIWKQSIPEHKTILLTLLILANYEEKEWEWKGLNYKCQTGEFITSAKTIIETAGKGITRMNVRTALSRFEKLGFLTIQSTSRSTKITICNWGIYQDSVNTVQPSNQPKTNQVLTINKKDKNDKNEKVYTEFELFYNQYHLIVGISKTDKVATLKKWEKLTSLEKIKAFEMITEFDKSITNKTYSIKARTYLENKRFNDEINNISKNCNYDNEKSQNPTFTF